jgi:hypothetical protein
MQVPSTQTIVNRPTLMADLLLKRRSLIHFDNQHRQSWNRGFIPLRSPEGSTPASYYRS